jgi:hypothetical protein
MRAAQEDREGLAGDGDPRGVTLAVTNPATGASICGSVAKSASANEHRTVYLDGNP